MAGQKRAQAPILKWRPGASVSAARGKDVLIADIPIRQRKRSRWLQVRVYIIAIGLG